MVNIDLLKKVTEAYGVSGYEFLGIRDIIKNEMLSLGYELEEDNLGSLIFKKKPLKKDAKSIMLAAHMDQIGLIVRHIDNKGFLRVSPLGGVDPETLPGHRLKILREDGSFVYGVVGLIPVHLKRNKEENKKIDWDSVYIDVGAKSKEEVIDLGIDIGSIAVWDGKVIELGKNRLGSLAFDNRISVYVLLEVAKNLKDIDLDYNIYFVFTTQEEVGLRGARTSTYKVDPDLGIVVDVTIAADVPGVQEENYVTKLGEGAAIKLLDGSVICYRPFVDFIKKIAKEKGISYQLEVLRVGGTDAGTMHITKEGVKVAGISIPTRYLHSNIEVLDKRDVDAVISLLTETLKELKNFNG